MNEHTAPTSVVRRIVVAIALVIALAAVAVPTGTADAGRTPKSAAMLPVELGAGADGPAFAEQGLALEVPVAAVGDRALLDQLDRGAELGKLTVGEPRSQAGPYHDSTTWSWEICVWVSLPSGAHYEWCFEISITVSTDVDAPPPAQPFELAAATDGEPLKLCWNETLENGTVVKRCIDITIKTGGSSSSRT
jgi:hypothetical protein